MVREVLRATPERRWAGEPVSPLQSAVPAVVHSGGHIGFAKEKALQQLLKTEEATEGLQHN